MQTTSKLSGKIWALCQIPPAYIPSHSAYLLSTRPRILLHSILLLCTLYHWIQCCNVRQYCSGTKQLQLQLKTLLVLKIKLADFRNFGKKTLWEKNRKLLNFHSTQHRFVFLSVRLHCKPIPVMRTGFSLCSISNRENPVFITGIPANENMEILHWENTVLALYWPCKGLQCT